MNDNEAVFRYFTQLLKPIAEAIERMFGNMNAITKVIFNEPATVVYWIDGTKTVVICQEGDVYDRRTGLLLCCAKKLFGNTGRYNDILAKALDEGGEE